MDTFTFEEDKRAPSRVTFSELQKMLKEHVSDVSISCSSFSKKEVFPLKDEFVKFSEKWANQEDYYESGNLYENLSEMMGFEVSSGTWYVLTNDKMVRQSSDYYISPRRQSTVLSDYHSEVEYSEDFEFHCPSDGQKQEDENSGQHYIPHNRQLKCILTQLSKPECNCIHSTQRLSSGGQQKRTSWEQLCTMFEEAPPCSKN